MRLLAGCISVGLAACAAPTILFAEAPMTVIDEEKASASGVQDYAVVEPMFEGVRVALAARGEKYSPAYIQGISWAAFRIAGICPCAPTCSTAMDPLELVKRLGFEVHTIGIGDAGVTDEKVMAAAKLLQQDRLPDLATVSDPDVLKVFKTVGQMIEAAKAEVRAGRPVPVWHAFTNAEWDVVTGFDSGTREFIGISSYKGTTAKPARAGEARTLTTAFIGGGASVMLIGQRIGEFDARAAEIAAIREAIRHGRDQSNVEKVADGKWVMLQGIAAYERWARDFEKPQTKRGAGDAYCWGIYSHTHAMAGPFLREIAPRYGEAQSALLKAADAFDAEAGIMAGGQKLLHWESPEGPDEQRNAAAAKLLKDAAARYAEGIALLEGALPLLGR